METYFTHNGTKFMIEPSSDFDDAGRMGRGHGFFLNLVRGNDTSGLGWFETETLARAYAQG